MFKASTKPRECAAAFFLRGLRGLPLLAGQRHRPSASGLGGGGDGDGDAEYGSAPLALLHQFFPQHLSDGKPGTC